MRRPGISLILGFTLLSLAHLSGSGVVSAASLDSLRIVVLGSSTAAGTGPSSRDSAWVWRYRAHLALIRPASIVHNLAVGGYTTYHVLPSGTSSRNDRPRPDRRHNLSAALALEPDAVVINLPSNDAAEDYSIREQIRNYGILRDSAAVAGVPIWVATTQPRNLNDRGRAKLVEMRDSTYSLFGDHTIDFWTGLALDDGRIDPAVNSGDGVHLNDAGHRLLFRRVVASSILSVVSGIEEMPPADLRSAVVYPNPARGRVTLQIQGHSPGEATVELFDIVGRRLGRSHQMRLHPGDNRLPIDLANNAHGLLVARVRMGNTVGNVAFVAY
jgi:lysophospholipase L1-like esterase